VQIVKRRLNAYWLLLWGWRRVIIGGILNPEKSFFRQPVAETMRIFKGILRTILPEAAMSKNEKSGRFCRDSSGSAMNQKHNPKSETHSVHSKTLSRDAFKKAADRVIKEHRPALEWLGDK